MRSRQFHFDHDFLGGGRVEVDHNAVERSVQALALKRKNALPA